MRIGIQTFGSEGDIRPLAALANGLADAGHEVSFAIASLEAKNHELKARRSNLTVLDVAYPTYDDRHVLETMSRLWKTRNVFKQLSIVLETLFDPLLDRIQAQSKLLCETSDVLIGHFLLYPLKTAADKAKKPYVTVTLNSMGIPSRFKAPMGLPSLGEWWNLFLWNMGKRVTNAGWSKRVNGLRVKEGLPPVKNVLEDVLLSRELNLIAISSALCKPMPDWGGRHHVCGFFNTEEADERWDFPPELQSFLQGGPPPVYMTFGSMLLLDPTFSDITKLLVESALKAKARAIIQSRWNEISHIPEHPDIFRIGNAPHQHIFPHCSAVVHHGGAGTTQSATRHGCPSIVVQHLLDQRFWGEELRRLRVAPKVLDRRSVTPARLADALTIVLGSPEMKKRAEGLGRIMQQEHGVRKAVEVIEDHFAWSATRHGYAGSAPRHN